MLTAEAEWDEWDAALVALLRRRDKDDLTVWPEHLPRPPEEPPGVFDRLCAPLDAAQSRSWAVLSLRICW